MRHMTTNALTTHTIVNKVGAKLEFPDYTIGDTGEPAIYALAQAVDAGTPDTMDSPGAVFLVQTYEAFVESVTYWFEDNDDVEPDIDDYRNEDAMREVADGAPSVYTHARWQQFVDLAAYTEDIDELGSGETDMTKLAGIALYTIAERIGDVLLDDIEITAAPGWEPNITSRLDGSEARLVRRTDDGTITLVNEDGDEWTDPVTDWEPIDMPSDDQIRDDESQVEG
jgi:hypothetical protein